MAAYGDEDCRIDLFDFAGKLQSGARVQDVQTRDAYDLRPKRLNETRHGSALETQIHDTNPMSTRDERRSDVLKPQRLSSEKGGESEMSCRGARFDQ